MNRRYKALIGAALVATAAYASGAGFYLPDSPWYRTTSGEEYSWTEPACASDVYPVDSILTLKDPATGESFSVHVNDTVELPPDRDIVLNAPAAAITGIDRTGWREGEIEVVYREDERILKDGGWWSFSIETAATNRGAMDTMGILRANNLKAYPEAREDGIAVSVRWIPSYQKEQVASTLRALGFEDFTVGQDTNPYL